MKENKDKSTCIERLNIVLVLLFVLSSADYCGQDDDYIISCFPSDSLRYDEVIMFPEIKPEFPGGTDSFMTYLTENLEYPNSTGGCSRGTVYIKFIILTDGIANNFTIIKGIGELYDNEAKRVLQSIDCWIPGEHNGEAVDSWYVVPIKFALE